MFFVVLVFVVAVRRSSFVVCCSLFVVRCSLRVLVVYCVLFVDGCALFIFCDMSACCSLCGGCRSVFIVLLRCCAVVIR